MGLISTWGNTPFIGRAKVNGTEVLKEFITGLEGAYGIAVNATHIFWVNLGGKKIGRAKVNGTEVLKEFITGLLAQSRTVAVSAANIYWSLNGGSGIGRAKLDGTEVVHEFIDTPGGVGGVAVDAQYLYWSDIESRSLGRARLDGSHRRDAFSPLPAKATPEGVALSAHHVWQHNLSTGKLERVKPLVVTLTNSTIGRSLALDIAGVVAGNKLSLDFFRRTIADGGGADRSDLLRPTLNDLWVSGSFVTGGNVITLELHTALGGALVASAALGWEQGRF